MEWSTESIEKVIWFVQERPFLFDVSSAELAWTCTKIWCKKLVQETCASFLRKFLDCVSPSLVCRQSGGADKTLKAPRPSTEAEWEKNLLLSWLGGLGRVVSSPNGVRGGAPAETSLGAFLARENHLVHRNLVFLTSWTTLQMRLFNWTWRLQMMRMHSNFK